MLKRGNAEDNHNLHSASRNPGLSLADNSSPDSNPARGGEQSEHMIERGTDHHVNSRKPQRGAPSRTNSGAKSFAESATSNFSILVDGAEGPRSTHVTIGDVPPDSTAATGATSTFSRNAADSASVRTIASSSRRRRSLDTNASTRAIAESVFSADSDHTWDANAQ